MDTVVRRFAARLHNLRAERGLSQVALAKRAHLHSSYIGALERASKIPSLTTLEQLAKALKVELSELVFFPESKSSKSDREQEEIQLISQRLKSCDLQALRRIRKAVNALTED